MYQIWRPIFANDPSFSKKLVCLKGSGVAVASLPHINLIVRSCVRIPSVPLGERKGKKLKSPNLICRNFLSKHANYYSTNQITTS